VIFLNIISKHFPDGTRDKHETAQHCRIRAEIRTRDLPNAKQDVIEVNIGL
jgi:hypothetical protein